MMDLKNKVQELAKELKPAIIGMRRHLHANPELSFQEFETASFVEAELKNIGLNPTTGVAGTGLTAVIEGRNPSKKVVALRADMDALPILEANEVPYRSTKAGIMHACGHDAHTSSLLGAAHILHGLRNDFEGSIKLIFQPGEETAPGGASLMIRDGALQNPSPVAILGQHVMPLIPSGKVGFRSGLYMASADEIYITVKGKGGHAAMPDNTVDPIVLSAHLIVAMQQIVSRNANPKIPSVLSFGHIEGLGATNVIPNEVKIKGTFRTLNEEWRAEAKLRIRKLAEGLVQSMGGQCEVNIVDGYPYLENEPELTNRAKNAAIDYLGAENVLDLDIWMASEDFSYYSHEMDACFYRLGTRNEAKGIVSGVHTPTFDIDEDSLEIGAGLMAWLAISELR